VKTLLAAIALAALAGGAYALLAPGQEGDEPRAEKPAAGGEGRRAGDAVDLSELEGELSGTACRRMAGVTASLAERGVSPLALLRELGRRVAGIRPPPRAFGDLARGGRDLLPGGGFRAPYDDGSAGQARHFAGIAVATTVVGGAVPTRLISERLRDDPRGSADGQLTEAGIEFATRLRDGDLALAEAPGWILENVCLP
jgi:hypothetical protein